MRKLNILDKYGDSTIMILSSQIRYNNRIRIKDEDLAQHSYYVAYNILRVGYDYGIDQNTIQNAVCRALVHDIDECYTADIPHDCKQTYPELRELVRNIGLKYIDEHAPEVRKYFEEYSNNNDLANLLVDIGDALSVLQYSNRELELGNRTIDMQVISNEIKARVTTLFEKLEETLKSNKKD